MVNLAGTQALMPCVRTSENPVEAKFAERRFYDVG
jgi:hypothetical protein